MNNSPQLTFANKITICRIISVPFFILTMLYYFPGREQLRYVAFGIFMFAVISDVIDGYIARTRDQKTKAGAILDPLADKILLISAFLCLYAMGQYLGAIVLPMWLVIAVISRDVMLLLGWLVIYMVQGDLNIQPSLWGKISTFFQISSVIGIFLQWNFSPILWDMTAVFTFISAVDYIRAGIKIINNGNGGQV